MWAVVLSQCSGGTVLSHGTERKFLYQFITCEYEKGQKYCYQYGFLRYCNNAGCRVVSLLHLQVASQPDS